LKNPEKAQPGWPPAVVAGAAITGVVLMRNLSRRGVRVHCIDHNRGQLGVKTRYGPVHICPDPDTQPAEWVRYMTGLAASIGERSVLIASSDQYVSAFARHGETLKHQFILSSSLAVQELLATKQRQYDVAGRHGLPVPRTQFVQKMEDVLEFASQARFPCLMKPVHFRHWEHFQPDHPLFGRKIALAASAEQLQSNYELAREVTPDVVLQEVIEGPDEAKLVYMSCYASVSGERLGSCIVRQLRTDPIYFGSASIVEPVEDPEVDGVCDRFLRSIQYKGLCELELKRDTRDGTVKLIEANPRYSVTSDAAPYAGVDIGWLHYLDLIEQPVHPVSPVRFNFRHIVLRRDFACFRSYRRAGLLTWGQFLRSYRPPVAFFDFDLRDWRVTLRVMVELVKIVAVPAIRRVFPKRRSI
jgi:predicted ATP-grasp superfamily ATP-dependent carboligase